MYKHIISFFADNVNYRLIKKILEALIALITGGNKVLILDTDFKEWYNLPILFIKKDVH